jgi:hypothetical protein
VLWHIPMVEATIYGIGIGLMVSVAVLVVIAWRVTLKENRFGLKRSVRPHLTVIKGGNRAPRELRPRARRERRRRSGS